MVILSPPSKMKYGQILILICIVNKQTPVLKAGIISQFIVKLEKTSDVFLFHLNVSAFRLLISYSLPYFIILFRPYIVFFTLTTSAYLSSTYSTPLHPSLSHVPSSSSTTSEHTPPQPTQLSHTLATSPH